MSVRPLPHFSHKPIGKTTHKKGMTYSHVNYITRDEACSKILAQNIPMRLEGGDDHIRQGLEPKSKPSEDRGYVAALAVIQLVLLLLAFTIFRASRASIVQD